MVEEMKYGSLGSQKHNKTKAIKRERKLAERLGGKAQSNSGSGDADKGDVKLSKYLLDDKFTESNGYTLKKSDLNTLTKQARGHNKEPILVIKYVKKVPAGIPSEWAIIPEHCYKGETTEEFEVAGKSVFLSISIISRLFRECLKIEKEVSKRLIFHKVTLGVARNWVLVPLEDLEKRGYFDEIK